MKRYRTKLDAACDYVICRKRFENFGNRSDSLDGFLLSVVESDALLMFKKITFIHPQVVIFKQLDSAFDHNGVLFDTAGEWSMISVDPTSMLEGETYNSVKEFCKIVGPGDDGLPRIIPIVPDISTFIDLQNELTLAKCEDSTTVEDVLKFCAHCNETVLQEIKSSLATITTTTTTPSSRGIISHKESRNWIAVIGMSCRFPQANSLEEYWAIFEQGRNTASTPPQERTGLCDIEPSVAGNFLGCQVDHFDAEFFGVAPSEADVLDPQSRLTLETSWEALEDAGIKPETLRGSQTGVFYGSWLQDYKEIMNVESPSSDNLRKYMSNGFGCSAAKLSFFYGLSGPNIAAESGCSSSIIAADLAVKSLLREECNLALVTGSNLILLWKEKRNVVWAPDGISKTFDAAVDGYGRAEGIGVLILKRYSEAVADNDRIYGVICGSGVSQEGESPSFGSPTVKSEAACMKACLTSVDLSPSDVDYIEAHGTGTAVGDPIEANAILEAYACSERKFPLYVASGKTNIGHSESCSGLAGIIKVLLSMQHETIPRHLNVSNLSSKINFEQIGAQIPLQSVPWPRNPARARVGAVSSFGITGTDVHMMLREAPVQPPPAPHPSVSMVVPQILCLSARTSPALEELTQSYLTFLGKQDDDDRRLLHNMAYTTNACRTAHALRRVITGKSKEELENKIRTREWTDGAPNLGRHEEKRTGVCFSFPGAIGKMEMAGAKELYSSFPVFKMNMDKCEALFNTLTNLSLLPALNELDLIGAVERLAAVIAVQYSLAQLWRSWGIKPSFVMGHCIGEIVAAVVAGVMRLEDGFKIAALFQRFIEVSAAQPGTMLAVGGEQSTVEQLIEKYYLAAGEPSTDQLLEVAALNSKSQTVVAGPSHVIQNFAAFCSEQEGIRVQRVPVDFPIHSRGIEAALQVCGREFIPEQFSPPTIPYVSSITGEVLAPGDVSRDYWFRCFRDKVRFTDACTTAVTTLGVDVFLEIGLGSSLTKLTLENVAGSGVYPACTPSFRRAGGVVATLASFVALGVDVDWASYYQFHPVSKVALPHYPFQRKPHWFKQKGNSKMTRVCETQLVHPLLGGKVSLADRQKLTFEVCLSSFAGVEFIKDHVIGDEVVFPAAGYLEMMLAAGIHDDDDDDDHDDGDISTTGGTRPCSVSIQHFSISAPLLVDSSLPESTKLQTVLELESRTAESRKVSVFSERGVNDWKFHASGTFTRASVVEPDASRDRIDVQEITRRVTLTDSNNGGVTEFYEDLSSVGLNFGESFRSIITFARNESEALAEVQVPLGGHDHLLHPILIDAMIQVCFMHKWQDFGRRLHVPVSIPKFEMLLHSEGEEEEEESCCCSEEERRRFYVYIKHQAENSSETRIVLADHHGATVAVMDSPGLAPTSVEAVLEAGRGAKAGSTLSTYEVAWERARYQIPIRPSSSGVSGPLSPALSTVLDAYSGRQLTGAEQRLAGNIDRLCFLYVLNMLYEVGWEPAEVGTQWAIADLISEFRVKEPLALAFSRYLDFLVEEGLMRRTGDRQTLTLTSAPPPWETVKEEIDKSLEVLQDYPALKVLSACGSKLRPTLQGELSGQFILFGKGEGDDDGDSLAETYYSTNRFREEERAAIRDVFEELCQELVREPGREPSERIRILEVGAGTGSFTRVGLENLAERGIPFEYHFTDISPAYFGGAKERFKDHEAHIAYKTLDIEKDPLAQGFPPAYFDIVVGVDVFHATSFLQKTIRHAGLLTRLGGRLVIGETEQPVREIDIIFGILSGYWAFQDTELRRSHCVVGSDCWERVLQQVGFSETCHLLTGGSQKSVIIGRKLGDTSSPCVDDDRRQTNNPHSWLAIGDHFPDDFDWFVRKMRGVGRDVLLAHCSSDEFMSQLIEKMEDKGLEGVLVLAGRRDATSPEWQDRRGLLNSLFTTCKSIGQRKAGNRPRLHLVSTGTWASGHEGDLAVLDPSPGALWGLARSVRMEISDLSSKSIDLDPAAGSLENLERLLVELWLDDKEPDVLHRQGLRYVRRLRVEHRKPPTNLEYPLASRFEISLPKSRAISDVRFVPKKEVGATGLSGRQIEVEMKSASLNFRDVLVVMRPAGSVFESMSLVGIDYAGVVTKVGPHVERLRVGQRVYGISIEESTISSHIVTEESHGIRIPPGLTFAEAATLPAVFLTVWYCMVEIAKVKPGQTVLVHAVTGGVGLAAIQLGKYLGVEVIGTAGSPRKRNFARSLGLKHVFNSRDLTFRELVWEATGGAGVDMVLNCLTGPGFKEASLELCKDGGHFVEISKLDVWSEEEVRSRRPGVNYKLIWVPEIEPEVIFQMMTKMNELVDSGKLRPLPMTRFQASQLPSALTTLQRAKQIGKVIVQLPSFLAEQNRFTEQLFGDSRTYLITGGLGAIGLAVAKWMASQGARYIVLVGRSKPKQVALEAIRQLHDEFKATVICSQADVSSFEQCKALLEALHTVDGFPPLGGIHHCAGVLNDKLLVNQDLREFEAVVKPKADGLFNLHLLTAHLPLQFFVAYSSMSSTMGNVGQGNYAAGNAYMDALMEARNETGLKGLVINWGQWKAGLAENFDVRFTIPFSITDGILALERFLLENKTSVVAGHFKFSQLMKMYQNYSQSFLKHMASGDRKREAGVGAKGKGEPFLAQYNKKKSEGMSDEDKDTLITSFVRDIICSILGLGTEEIEDNAEFSNMGMDSLMSIDFTNKLQSELPGVDLGYIDMAAFGSVNKMGGFIAGLIN